MFNFPLTIKVDLPTGATVTGATQDGAEVEYFVEDGFVYVDAVPDAGKVVINIKK